MDIPALPHLKLGYSEVISSYLKMAAPIAVVLASVLVLVLVVWPKFSDVLALRRVNDELSDRAQKLESKAQKLSSYDKSELESQLGRSEALIPSDKEVFSLVAQIERAASSAGVVLNKVDVSPGSVGNAAGGAINVPIANSGTAPTPADTAAGTTPKVQLKVSISSDYKSFLQFLNNVLAFSRTLVVRDLTLSAVSGTEQAGGQIRTLITIDAYYLPLPKELSSIEAPIEDLTPSEIARLNQVRAGSSGAPALPPVQGGRSDLFAPF